MNPRWRDVLLYAGLATLLLIPRLPGLDAFATADEPYWLSMGANFYYALGQREFENTIYEYQPAVTTMWVVTAAMLAYYPEYRGLGQGYLEFEKGVLDPFLLEHGKDPLVLLRDARLIQVLLIVILLLVAFHLLRRLVGTWPALAGLLLASFDPFFLGQSRLLNHEAMLSCFVLISALALTVYLFQERKFIYLLLSAITGALAQLTKSSAIALLVPTGVLLLVDLLRHRMSLREAFLDKLKVFALWLVILAASYVLFWPGMWVAPGRMLSNVYGNAFSYAFQGARLIALQNAEAASIGLETSPGSFSELAYTILWRTTPMTWIGFLFGIVLILRRPERADSQTRLVGLLLVITGLTFVIMFALAQGRNSPHYTLAAYLTFNLLAGMGWLALFQWLPGSLGSRWVTTGGMIAAIALQAGSGMAQYPYYFTYENPLLASARPQQRPQFAYGEGLELAGKYLASLPGAKDSVALVYYSRGCFSYFFPGQTERFKPYYVERGHEPELRDALQAADYLVLYPAVQGGVEKYAPMFATLARSQPMEEIRLNGYLYAVIYRVDGLPLNIYEQFAPNSTK